jgi:hypothetical protein
MPAAGAGRTLGAVLGSGNGGYKIEGPRGARCTGGAGEDVVEDGALGAMADVARRFIGRRGSSLGIGGAGVLLLAGGGMTTSGGLGVLLP